MNKKKVRVKRTYQRLLRLDEDLKEQFERLPYLTGNSVINHLLRLFFDRKDIQKLVATREPRLKDWARMMQERDYYMTVASDRAADKEAEIGPIPPGADPNPPAGSGIIVETVDKPLEVLNEILPDK